MIQDEGEINSLAFKGKTNKDFLARSSPSPICYTVQETNAPELAYLQAESPNSIRNKCKCVYKHILGDTC